MAQVLSAGGVKPQPWRVRPRRVAPEWRWVWDKLVSGTSLVVSPFWSGGGSPVSVLDGQFGSLSANSTPTWQPGRFGWELSFPRTNGGSDNWVRWNTNRPTSNIPMTVAAIVRPPPDDGNHHVIGSNSIENAATNKGVLLGLQHQLINSPWGYQVVQSPFPSADVSDPAFDINHYFFVAGSYDGSELRLLVRDLTTEVIGTDTVVTSISGTAGNGYWGFGHWKDISGRFDMPLGVVADISLTFNEMKLWSFDPFGPFRPQRVTLVSVPGGAQTISVGQATETETALGAGAAKSRSVGQATESEAALALTAEKAYALGLASEAEAALAVSIAKALAAGQATESESAPSVTTAKAAQVGRALASESALSLTVAKLFGVGLSTETDAAPAVSQGTGTPVGQATETDAARSVSTAKAATVGLATSTEQGLTVTPLRSYAIGTSSEVDQSLSVTLARAVELGIATESDTGHAIVPLKEVSVGRAGETDEALAVLIVGAALDLRGPFTMFGEGPARTMSGEGPTRTMLGEGPERTMDGEA